MVRYYGWYSNKMRGQRRKRAEEPQEKAACEYSAAAEQGCGALASAAIEIIEHPALKPRRIPSRSWRELIKKVWEVDPLLCPYDIHDIHDIPASTRDAPRVAHQRRADHRAHLAACWLRGGVDQWVNEIRNHGVRIVPSTGPPATETIECGLCIIEPWLDDPMPDYDCNPPLCQV